MKHCIWFFLVCFLAVGCSGEEDGLTPSRADRDWFLVEDSDDPIGHELYLIYKKYDIPVFVNDTIGREERGMDYYGNPVVYYYVLDINYTVGAPVTDYELQARRYSLLQDPADRMAGIAFLDNYLIPALPKGTYFKSILLLDSLYEMRLSGVNVERKDLNVYEGLMTLVIGQGKAIANMSQDEQNLQKGLILGTLAINYLNQDQKQLDDFYLVSYDPVKKQSYYGQQVSPSPAAWLQNPDCGVYGFLDYGWKHPVVEGVYTNVNQKADLEDFVFAFFQYSERAFNEKYEGYPLILKKYEMIKGILNGMGYTAESN